MSDELVVVRTIFDLEQTDPDRIRQERDLLAQAIVEMGIGIGLMSPDAIVTGPHLLQICQDVVDCQREAFNAAKDFVMASNELVADFVTPK